MAATLSSSPFSSPPLTQKAHGDLEAQLDDQILTIRAEIAKLRAQKIRLSSALLGSSKIQKCVQARKLDSAKGAAQSTAGEAARSLHARLDRAVESQKYENDVKIHRLAYGVTAFPFTDPSPERAGESTLTGVRFDLSGWNSGGMKNESALDSYFVVFRRIRHQRSGNSAQEANTYLKVHHHTIPAHIDLESLFEKYLPLPQELQDDSAMDIDDTDGNGNGSRPQSESFNDDSGIDVTQDINFDGINGTSSADDNANIASNTTQMMTAKNGQNLHAFILALLDDLQSWHNRVRAIAYLRKSAGLPPLSSRVSTGNEQMSVTPDSNETFGPSTKYSISNVAQTTADAYQIRIVWKNDALGLLKLSYEGRVDRAVVYGVKKVMDSSRGAENTSKEGNAPGSQPTDHERLHDIERILTFAEPSQNTKVQGLLERLKYCEEVMCQNKI
ncbi:hypothetical protein H2198_008759 [Neophaeococcomyces mojaviensis]|uniref:Uncharacterized protein n=1 Tax=Neophaeococcomyces mojaviensis TaxID=3383035 RepID=A0ACC2ZWH0_9EURO|nr:hypothetical protein H2198_008759 [Knufia sp. JES_112]